MKNFFRSVTFKFFLLLLLSLTAVFTSFIFLSANFIKDFFVDRTVTFVNRHVSVDARDLKSEDFLMTDQARTSGVFQKIFDDIKTEEIIRIKVWDKNQTIIYSDEPSIVGMRFPDETDLLEALEGRTVFEIGEEKSAENVAEQSYGELLQVYVPVTPSGESMPAGIIEVYFAFDGVNREISEAQLVTTKIGAVLIVLTLLLFIIFFSIFVRRPLFLLRRAAQDMGTGNLSARANVKTTDEFGALGVSFNDMASKLGRYQKELEEDVKQKTEQLSEHLKKTVEQNARLDDTKKAMLNILEDLQREKVALAEDVAKREALLTSVGEAVVATDKNGRIVFMNDPSAELLGCAPSEAIGKHHDDCVKIEDEKTGTVVSFKSGPMSQAIETGKKIQSSNYTLVSPKKRLSVLLTVTPVLADGVNIGVIEVFRDISEEKRIDRAKTEFVSLASHQLRTPLTAIKWYAELLLSGDAGKLTKPQKKYFDEINRSNQRMIDLVGALLDVSRIELGTFMTEFKPVNLREVGHSVLEDLAADVAKKKLVISEEYQKNVPVIQADPRIARIVLQNLLSNAVKYTPGGGAITIVAKKEKSGIVISVRDTGYGIPEESKQHIFTRFFRAANIREVEPGGTGLGLYIVKSAMEHIGGRVWFESEEGKGTTFHVAFPLLSAAKANNDKAIKK